MAALETPKVHTGWRAPDFSLKAADGRIVTFAEVKGRKGTLVMFICNHCPFVKAVLSRLLRDAKELQTLGMGVAAIMSNDVRDYPEDSFDNMKKLAEEKYFTFPYLYDETQEVARAYGAVCTPDFFGFNNRDELQYRGRLDGAGRSPDYVGPRELFQAMQEIAATGRVLSEQKPSIGCSIKWKEEKAA